MLFYTFKIAERLGKRQREVVAEWDMKEIIEWMAYDMACDEEFRERILLEQALESQRNNTAEQEAALIRNMFAGLGNNVTN